MQTAIFGRRRAIVCQPPCSVSGSLPSMSNFIQVGAIPRSASSSVTICTSQVPTDEIRELVPSIVKRTVSRREPVAYGCSVIRGSPVDGRLQCREIHRIRLKCNNLVKWSSVARRNWAMVSPSKAPQSTKTSFRPSEKRREILDPRIDHLTRDIPQAEAHLTVKLLASLPVQQGSSTPDLFIVLDIITRSLPNPMRQQPISVVRNNGRERDNIGRPESPELVDAGPSFLRCGSGAR